MQAIKYIKVTLDNGEFVDFDSVDIKVKVKRKLKKELVNLVKSNPRVVSRITEPIYR